MTPRTFEIITHPAGTSQDRRASLKALGAVGLAAALTMPSASKAKNKTKKKCKKKVKQKCDQQIEACQAATDAFCVADPDCFDALLPCCELLADCDASSAVTCIFNAFPIHGG